MIDTLQALLVVLLAVLPGALYTLARENFGATWAWRSTDTATQIFRFVSASAFLHAVLAPLTYWAYRRLIAAHELRDGKVSWWWWGGLALYVLVPYLWGAMTEWSRGWQKSSCCLVNWTKTAVAWLLGAFIGGRDPEPRAWDRLFSRRDLEGYVRLKLKDDGGWKAGAWYDSYASGYGEDSDLYIGVEVEVDKEGNFLDDGDREPVPLGRGLLIRWSEVEYLDFQQVVAGNGDRGGSNA